MKIVKMTSEHESTVLEMMRVFYASDAVYTNGSEEIFKNDIAACISDSPYLEGYVFLENDEVIGYSMLAHSFSTEFGLPCVWIEDIYISDSYRGRGIGTKFFEFLDERYKGSILRLEAEHENKNAVHLYEKSGFDVLPYLEMKKII